MIIEVCGTGFGNKGAELMLAAILAELSQRFPQTRVAARPGMGPYDRRARYGLLQIFDAAEAGRAGWLIERLVHAGYRSRYGLVAPSDVDAVLDASGYALGDPWKPEWIEGRAQRFEAERAAGKPVVLLPQAMGPFADRRVQLASRRVLIAASLVFARDPESLVAAQALLPSATHLHLAPDFTNLLEGRVPPHFANRAGRVALIPNHQMLAHGGDGVRDRYVPFFVQAAARVRRAGYEPILLLHEDKADLPIAESIRSAAQIELALVSERDPVALKGIIGSCEFTLGSRYHGLVSALSQGVPSIGTSWAHKYRYLFEDYGVPELLCRVDDESTAWARLDELAHGETREALKRTLLLRGHEEKRKARGMWDRIQETLVAASASRSPSPFRNPADGAGPNKDESDSSKTGRDA